MNRLKFYQRLALVSGLVLVLLNHFAFGFLGFFIPRAKAASVNWVGTSGGSWHDPANWSGGEVPTGLDEVTITGDDMFVLATTTIDFTSLTLAGPDVRFGLVGNIGTGGDITVSSSLLIQGNATRQTITGTLSLTNGGTLTHLQNTSTTLYTVDFVAEDVIIESGAQVRVDNEGNPGGGVGEDGYGDGGGDANTNGVHGGGASNAGMGGQSSDGNVGGNDTCTFSDLGPLYGGSGGAGSAASSGGDGGGFVRLEANNSIIVNGRITADADGSGSEIAGEGAGGGAGGTIHLVANTVSGIPELIAARGGNSFDSNGGGGGGGCVRIEYDTTTSISGAEIIVDGGVGFENGGAGLVLVEKIDESARHMYLTATTTAAYGASQMFGVADTNFEGFIDQVTTLSLSTTSRYVVTDSVGAETFSITSSSPFGMSSPSGTLQIGTGVNLRLVSGATIENATLELINDLPTSGQNRYVTVTEVGSSNPATFSIGANGVLVMNNFTTTTPLVLESFTVESGGLLTHTQNSASPEQTQMVHIQAEEITIESGGLVDVSGKGFSGGIDGEDGNGPGGGEFVDMFTGVGAGHGGDGAASDTSGNATGSGGSAYCDASNPRTLGSGGASGFHYEGAGVDGGFGGGLVWLVASSSLTLQGDIFADGTDGAFESFVGDVVFQSISGGGAGGGVKLYAPQIMGAGEIFARGGDNGVDSSPEPTEYGGGGGGCVLVNYVETNQVTSSSIYVAGGGLSDGVAEVGLSSVVKENEAPQLFLNIYPPSKVGEVADAVDLNEPLDVVVSSTFAYVVAYADNSMRVIDVSSSTDPQIVGGVKDDTDLFMPVSLAMSGQYVFVAAFGDNSMRVIDVSSSTDPQIVGGVKDDTDLAGIGSIEIVGQYAYVTGVSGDFFRIIDISDPLDPQILGGIVDPVSLNGARGIAISGNYAYVLSQFDQQSSSDRHLGSR
jgi:hypothetical protein